MQSGVRRQRGRALQVSVRGYIGPSSCIRKNKIRAGFSDRDL